MTTFGYGQIDLLITACVVVDLVYGERSRAGGLGIGLAAALKLTPLVFIPYLALTGRGGWQRGRSQPSVSIAVALVVLPGDARSYWFGGKFMDLSRVTGGTRSPERGGEPIAARCGAADLLRHLACDLIWLVACLAVAGLGLLLACARQTRR